MVFITTISHRGNLRGPEPDKENNPSYIDLAIKELYEVEVDIRYIEGNFYLGHDNPEYFVDLYWLKERSEYLILHCKNLSALYLLKDQYHCFWHENDCYTLTTKQKIWTYPDQPVGPDCIIVDLEPPTKQKLESWKTKGCYGVCSDYADMISYGSEFLPSMV